MQIRKNVIGTKVAIIQQVSNKNTCYSSSRRVNNLFGYLYIDCNFLAIGYNVTKYYIHNLYYMYTIANDTIINM